VRYCLRGLEIRSENAAKPIGRAALWVCQWISRLPLTLKVLDYGCGKLRYTIPLSKRVRSVIAVDSQVQISRQQVVAGRQTTIPAYALDRLGNVQVVGVESFSLASWAALRADLAVCCNVLSAIPVLAERNRVLRRLALAVAPGGYCLFVTQFKNTYFDSYAKRPGAQALLDGWLVPFGLGASFYGVIPPKELAGLVASAGFSVVEEGSIGESAFVLARVHSSSGRVRSRFVRPPLVRSA
jgi:SAM-dependent methyltransferase